MRARRRAGEAPIKLLLTIDEAAQALSLGRNSLYKLIVRGQIQSLVIGRNRRIPFSSLEHYVAQQLAQICGGEVQE